MTDPFNVNRLQKWAEFEMECLWGELREAHRRGHDGEYRTWTVGCEHIAERITTLSAIIGPLSWRRITIPAIADGWFVAMNVQLGISGAELPSEDDVAYAQMWVARQIESVT